MIPVNALMYYLSLSYTSGGHKAGRSNYKHLKKMTTVDEICKEVAAKHGDNTLLNSIYGGLI